VIRQAISCDICGRDKQQTNHWFVAYEHGVELRVRGWSAQARMSAKAKHLCGQTCLHKLVDEYMARALAERIVPRIDETAVPEQSAFPAVARTDASFTSAAAQIGSEGLTEPIPASLAEDDFESSARLIDASPSSAPAALQPAAALPQKTVEEKPEPTVRVIMPILELHDESVAPGRPAYNPRSRRADAWKREQEREKRTRTGSRRRSLV
jgi:hypothetical protein